MIRNLASSNTDTKFAEFKELFRNSGEMLYQAVELEEKLKADPQPTIHKMLEAAEKYKAAMNLHKKAQAVNLITAPIAQQKEAAKCMSKRNENIKDASERLVELMNAIARMTGNPTTHSSLPTPSTKTTSALPGSSGVGAPRSARAQSAENGVRRRLGRISPNTIEGKKAMLRGVDSKLGEALLDEMLSTTEVKLSDVAGCATAKVALEEAVMLPVLNPDLFTGLRQPVKGILLFGPPGNGKTMLAKALATESEQMFFNVSASSLTSKWVGDSEKAVRALFQIARNSQPCIIFIDEIDSLLCSRSEKEADHARRLKTEFLVQFDGATSKSTDKILVIGATNRPQELDDAVLRRFSKRILIGLPDEMGRRTLIDQILKKHDLDKGLSESDIRYIASKAQNYSNSDLVALCKEASMVPLRNMSRSQLTSMTKNQLRCLKRSDFDEALTKIKPASNPRLLEALNQFAQESGST